MNTQYPKTKVEMRDGALYVDDMPCRVKAEIGWVIRQTNQSAEEYIIEKERGYPLRKDERVGYRDGNRLNLTPSNIVVFRLLPGEHIRGLRGRMSRMLGHTRLTFLDRMLEDRVPDLKTRKLSGKSSWTLAQQMQHCQYAVGFLLNTNMPEECIRECVKNMIAMRYPDVRLSDIVTSRDRKIPSIVPESVTVVTVKG